jgi:hypothetical protein
MSFRKMHVGVSADCSDTGRSAPHVPDDQAIEQILLDHRDVLAHMVIPSTKKGKPTTVHGTRRKHKLAKSACNQCQKRKTKCSDERPVCRSCSDRDLACSWTTISGLTRTADLKKKVYEAAGRSDDLDTFLDTIRRGTDQVSSMLLAKLRCGMSLRDLLLEIRLTSSAIDLNGLDLLEEAANARLSLISLCHVAGSERGS